MHTLAYASILVVLAVPPAGPELDDSGPESQPTVITVEPFLATEQLTIEFGRGIGDPFVVQNDERLDHNTVLPQWLAYTYSPRPAQALEIVPDDFVGPLAPHQRTESDHVMDLVFENLTSNSPIIYGGPFNERTLAHQKGGAIAYAKPYFPPLYSDVSREIIIILSDDLFQGEIWPVRPSEPTLAPDDDPSTPPNN